VCSVCPARCGNDAGRCNTQHLAASFTAAGPARHTLEDPILFMLHPCYCCICYCCYSAGGVYLRPHQPAALLQYLLGVFSADTATRASLSLGVGSGTQAVDYRASCFCHKNVIDTGYICSVCLSIFCKANMKLAQCPTCGSQFKQAAAAAAGGAGRGRGRGAAGAAAAAAGAAAAAAAAAAGRDGGRGSDGKP
jgi:hypothetical protein